ncbi:transposase [Paenibacillus sp. WST5]|uniref:Transposase n=1 Tax=Paenibacillus sedimenti TaxID=2770274 RepID=A0A926QNK6_9BACL|nr:transposase [Paenibacillus sedimenti]
MYGSPKVTQKLNQQGIDISERSVTRIMKEQQWRFRTVKKHKATTNAFIRLSNILHQVISNASFTLIQYSDKIHVS